MISVKKFKKNQKKKRFFFRCTVDAISISLKMFKYFDFVLNLVSWSCFDYAAMSCLHQIYSSTAMRCQVFQFGCATFFLIRNEACFERLELILEG